MSARRIRKLQFWRPLFAYRWARSACLIFCSMVVSAISSQFAFGQSCTFAFDNLNFGSIDLTAGGSFTTTGDLTANCTGTPGLRVRICPHIGSGTGNVAPGGDPRFMLNGANQLQFNIFRNAGYTKIWGSNYWGQPPKPPQPRVRLNAAGIGTRVRPVRAEIYSGQTTLPGGVYTSSFAGGHTLVSYAYDSVGNCNAIGTMNGVQVPFIVTANNIGSCTVSTSPLNFGTTSGLGSVIDAVATISVACLVGVPYTISLGNGGTGSGPAARLMLNGGEDISYGIYQNAARSAPWGDAIGTNTVASTGTSGVQSFSAYGRVPVQVTPTSGTYVDTVIITLTY